MAGGTGLITEVSLVRRILQRVLEDTKTLDLPLCLALPDDGAAKRIESVYIEVEKSLGIHLPIVFGAKRRATSRQSEIKELFGELEALKGALAIMLDDELATGGTNDHTAAALKAKHGAAQVWAAVTHGVFCPGAEVRFADTTCSVDRVYSTDTIPFDSRPHLAELIQSGRLRVISWLDDLVKLIYFHHWDLSIRAMR
jgi:phosphoribosylpyrophosphate synthetase